jgi:PBS lyase HEAT-like repeat
MPPGIGGVLAMVRNPGRRVVLPLLVIAGVVTALWWMCRVTEPQYQGRTVSYWARQLSRGNEKERVEAREAVRAMGKSAVPFLAHVVRTDDTWWKASLRNSYGARFPILFRWFPPPSIPATNERREAAFALGEIGPAASKAIPALEWASIQNDGMEFVARAASMKVRGESIGPLLERVKNPGMTGWSAAAALLPEFGTNARAAVPALCGALTSTSEGVNSMAAYALGQIHSEAGVCVPALMENMKRQEAGSRIFCFHRSILALGLFEGDAKMAIPLLLQHQKDADVSTRIFVMISLCRILPSEEAKAMVIQNLKDENPVMRIQAGRMLKEKYPEEAAKAGVM